MAKSKGRGTARTKLHRDGFRCGTCGEFHEGPPFDYAAPAPDPWLVIPEQEREDGMLSEDLCWMRVRGKDHYFIRGLIPVPVRDDQRTFNWGVWAEIFAEDFARVIDLWDDERRADAPPFPGLLMTAPAIYSEPTHLELMVQLQGQNLRPTFDLTGSEHPMAVEQRKGITVDRVKEIAEALLHPN